MAATIPDEVKSNIPINKENMPSLEVLAKAPCESKWPNDVIGTSAPPPHKSTILS